MTKVDFKKELKELYSAKRDKIAIIQVPKMKFLIVDGMGDPETSQDFQDAIAALYGVAYTTKFSMKADPPKGYFEFVVPPLEALWWMDPGPFDPQAKDKWQWQMMVMQPDFVTGRVVDQAIRTLKDKKPTPGLDKLRYEPLNEGLCLQTLHIGPYNEVGKTIEKLLAFADENGYRFAGKHHEIYLSDPRRAAPEKLKTIIREPVTRQ